MKTRVILLTLLLVAFGARAGDVSLPSQTSRQEIRLYKGDGTKKVSGSARCYMDGADSSDTEYQVDLTRTIAGGDTFWVAGDTTRSGDQYRDVRVDIFSTDGSDSLLLDNYMLHGRWVGTNAVDATAVATDAIAGNKVIDRTLQAADADTGAWTTVEILNNTLLGEDISTGADLTINSARIGDSLFVGDEVRFAAGTVGQYVKVDSGGVLTYDTPAGSGSGDIESVGTKNAYLSVSDSLGPNPKLGLNVADAPAGADSFLVYSGSSLAFRKGDGSGGGAGDLTGAGVFHSYLAVTDSIGPVPHFGLNLSDSPASADTFLVSDGAGGLRFSAGDGGGGGAGDITEVGVAGGLAVVADSASGKVSLKVKSGGINSTHITDNTITGSDINTGTNVQVNALTTTGNVLIGGLAGKDTDSLAVGAIPRVKQKLILGGNGDKGELGFKRHGYTWTLMPGPIEGGDGNIVFRPPYTEGSAGNVLSVASVSGDTTYTDWAAAGTGDVTGVGVLASTGLAVADSTGPKPIIRVAANGLDAADIAAGAITSSELADSSVDTAALLANSVTASRIASGAVGVQEIAANGVAASELADSAVDAASILANAITAPKIAAGAVGVQEIATDGVAAAEIAANAVGTSEIATDGVEAAEIATGAVTSAELADSSVDTASILANAVTASRIASGAVGVQEIASDGVDRAELTNDAVGAAELDFGEFMTGYRTRPFWIEECMANNPTGVWLKTALASGTSAAKAVADANHPGQFYINSSSSTNSGAAWATGIASSQVIGGGECFAAAINITTTTNFVARIGFLDSWTVAAAPTDAAYIYINATTLDGRTDEGVSAVQITDTTYTISTATWYRVVVVVNAAGSRVDFYVFNDAGSQLWTDDLQASIPSSGDYLGSGLMFYQTTAGNTELGVFDYIHQWFDGRSLTR